MGQASGAAVGLWPNGEGSLPQEKLMGGEKDSLDSMGKATATMTAGRERKKNQYFFEATRMADTGTEA